MGAGVPCSMRLLGCALVFLAISSVAFAADSAPACTKGDSACFCKAIGGTWKDLKSPLLPACQVNYSHQDQERYVHVYFPSAYDGVAQWPIWVHLHGVFWATMGDVGQRVGHAVNGTDIIPAFDHSVEIVGDKTILVYPQSLGEAGKGDPDEGQGKKYRQFWRIPFWRCSVGICRDPSIDDIGFIEKVVADLPTRLPLKPGHYFLSGESAGGMMVHALLCQSKTIPAAFTAAVDMLGGIGADYMNGPECAASPAIPFLKLQGIEDPFITYSKQILVDGVNFASSIESVQLRARANGCGPEDSGPKDVSEADGKMLCTDFCSGAKGKPPAKLCGMPTVGHDTDHPHPGFVYEQSWAWFQQQAAAAPAKAAARKTNKTKGASTDYLLESMVNETSTTPAANATRANATRASVPAARTLLLNITFPGANEQDFKGEKGAQAVAAVANATGLPERNITVTYISTGGQPQSATGSGSSNRQHRRHLAAAAAEPGIVASYSLQTSNASKVVKSVRAAVKDGSLLQTLQQKGLTPAATAADASSKTTSSSSTTKGPLLSLETTGAAGKHLLEPTDLAKAAAAAKTTKAKAATNSSGTKDIEKDVPYAEEDLDAPPAEQTDAAAAGAAASRSAEQQPSAATNPSSSSSPPVGAIVGGVVGGVGGAALLAGAVWAVAAGKKKQQQQQQQQQEEEVLPQSKQPQSPGVIHLTADAVMVVSDDMIQKQ